ncbi:MAG: hypothetical protein WBG92_11800 [Thiohalocapsa sp.]
MAEQVSNKERANFCGFFDPSSTPAGAERQSADAAMRQAADDVFKQ